MIQCEIKINHPTGLHARPAALFVQAAKTFASAIRVKSGAGTESDAKSIMGIMSLGIKSEETITLTADGADEAAALDKLKSLVETNFGEG